MIRASVTANDVGLADAIATILAEKLVADVLQQSYRPPSHVYAAVRHPGSIVIDVDEGLAVNELLIMRANFRADDPMLLIKLSLKSRNISVFRSYTLVDRPLGQLPSLVREFFQTIPGAGASPPTTAQKSVHSRGSAR